MALACAGLPAALGAPLFVDAPESVTPPSSAAGPLVDPTVMRSRPVAVDFSLLGDVDVSAAPTLRFNLFDDADYMGEIQREMSRSASGVTFQGTLVGEDYGHFALRVEGDVMAASIHDPGGRIYQIVRRSDGLHEILEFDPAAIPACGQSHEHLIDAASAGAEGYAPSAPPVAGEDIPVDGDTGDLIDVMVVYTPLARQAAGGTPGIEAIIQLAVDETNVAYEESQVIPRLRLVHMAEVDYTDDGDMNNDIIRLRSTTDGIMDEVHDLRDEYGADQVVLIVQEGNYCGLAYTMTSSSFNFAPFAFSAVRRTCATGYYSFGHELSHNLGCVHDHDNSSNGLFDHSYGHRFTGTNSVQYRTVMAYSPGARIQRFSNPDVLYEGTATGVALGQPEEAHNALSISTVAPTAANWRDSVGLPAQVSLGGDVVGCSTDLQVEVVDAGEAGNGSLQVTVTTGEGDSETFNAAEEGGGIFRGSLPVEEGEATRNDGTLQLTHDDTVSAHYLDADPSILITETAAVDCVPPDFAGVASSVSGVGMVTLSWDAATDANPPMTYLVCRAEGASTPDFGTPLATTTTLSFDDTTGVVGTLYTYAVRARDGAGNPDSNTVTVTGLPAGDLDHFDFAGVPAELSLGESFEVTVIAKDSAGNTVEGYGGAVFLAPMVDGVEDASVFAPFLTDGFTLGQWTGTVTPESAADGVQLRAHIPDVAEGLSAPFDVTSVNFTVAGGSVVEGDGGEVQVIFDVTVDQPGSGLQVDYMTYGGSATAGEDYLAASGTLVFPENVGACPVTVEIVGDLLHEDDEVFTLALSSPSVGRVDGAPAAAMIIDDDEAPSVSVADVEVSEGGAAIFTLTLSRLSAVAASVEFSTAGGTAQPGADFAPAAGTVLIPPGETTRSVLVATVGDMAHEDDETFTLVLAQAQGATVADASAMATILDDDLEPQIMVVDTVAEEGGSAVFTVTLSAPSAYPVSVELTTDDGTALAGEDYQPRSGTLLFNPGATIALVPVNLLDDALHEEEEAFTLSLSNPSGATLGESEATATVEDDDPLPVLIVTGTAVSEGDTGTAPAEIVVALSEASPQPVTVEYTTEDRTAEAGFDYTPTSGTLHFAPGETEKTITVTVLGDTSVEEDETFAIALVNPIGAVPGEGEGLATVLNDDHPPTLSLGEETLMVGEGDGELNFTVTLSGSPQDGEVVRFEYATVRGTARPSDYHQDRDQAAIEPGQGSVTITVAIRDDSLDEGNEEFSIRISDVSRAVLGVDEQTVVIVDDDGAGDVVLFALLGNGDVMTEEEIEAADANQDGRIDVADLVRVNNEN